MLEPLSRRAWITATTTALAASSMRADTTKDQSFGLMLNTATIMGQKLSLTEQIDVAAKAGYDALEPWVRDLEAHVGKGQSLKDAAKRIKDHGLTIESAIGFAPWIVDDATARKRGLEQAKRDMAMVRELGGTRIAAPPVGATEKAMIDLRKVADRYFALCEVGDSVGVVPQVELWGFSKSLSRLGETAHVMIDSGHPKACLLADVYHLHKGGSGFGGIKLLAGTGMQVFHLNDYPAEPPRERITDAHRIYPGDGVAPLVQMLRDLRSIGFRGMLSLELFNRDYWKQDALQVAKTGLAKMKAVVNKAMAG